MESMASIWDWQRNQLKDSIGMPKYFVVNGKDINILRVLRKISSMEIKVVGITQFHFHHF